MSFILKAEVTDGEVPLYKITETETVKDIKGISVTIPVREAIFTEEDLLNRLEDNTKDIAKLQAVKSDLEAKLAEIQKLKK